MERSPKAWFLNGRALTELPSSLRQARQLRHLDVRDNRLSAPPGWLAELPELESLSIGGNPLGGGRAR
jgi:Leucine-rich repeat (LRR) protein